MEWIASVTSSSSEGLSAVMNNPPESVDIVEIRLDLLGETEISAAVAASPLPVLGTYRSQEEGGQGSNDPAQRRNVLRNAIESGVHLIDLEWSRDRHLIHEFGLPPERVILSWHDNEGTPRNLNEISAAMLAEPVALVKIIPTAKTLGDLERILRLSTVVVTPSANDRSRLIAFGMGPIGVPSRYLAPLLGAPFGFGAWDPNQPAASGQKTPQWMKAAVGHLKGPPRRLFGVVGSDVTSSLSPALHGSAFAACGFPDLLIPISVPDPAELDLLFQLFGETLFDRLNLPVHGWAVTTPFKVIAAEAATLVVPRVRRSGAANTLLLKKGQIIAENTDADGVVGSLTAGGVQLAGASALVQGTGGAARGAAVGLDLAGADVLIRGRDGETTRRTAEEIDVGWCHPDEKPDAQILINATPLGRTAGDPPPFSVTEIETAAAVVDMVYGEEKTALVVMAEDAGILVIDGRTMLAFQGMAQFAAFTTTPPPRDAMLKAVGASPYTITSRGRETLRRRLRNR